MKETYKMGFSLQNFFDELAYILENASDSTEALSTLKKYIEDSKMYAKECGVLD